VSKLDEIIRVDYAGEYGAKRIYEGQIKAMAGSSKLDLVKEMKEQEQPHLDYFANKMLEGKVRPSVFMPLWHAGGFALGYITGKMGDEAAMTATRAVEEVITEHYDEQLTTLDASEIKENIAKFRIDEQHHHDTAVENNASDGALYHGIKMITRTAIFLSKRF
jgi:3-demethoxyubiquinol 3-hydroxylase